jgi:hypothetical protein
LNIKLNPFVYAFSNRAIRRSFREVIFRRYCCCDLRFWLCRHFCPKKPDEYNEQYLRPYSSSFTTQTSQVAPRRTSSFSAELIRPITKTVNGCGTISNSPKTPNRTPGSGGPVVSFADFLVGTNDDDDGDGEILSNDNNQSNPEYSPTIKHKLLSNLNQNS